MLNHTLLAQSPIVNPVLTGTVGRKPEELLGTFISVVIGAMLTFASIWALFQLLQGGLEWISSGGDKTGVENARNRITNSLLGILITFAVWVIYIMLLQFLGIIKGPGAGGFELKIPTL